MATTSMVMSDSVAGYLNYCLYGKKDKDAPKTAEKTRRDAGTVSTFLHDEKDIPGVLAELSLSAGRKAEAHCERISPDPKDAGKKLTIDQWKQFFSECAEELEPGQPHFIVLHNDGNNGDKVPHGHVFFPWRWIDLKHGAHAEGIRRQDAIDKVCRRWGLSVVPREPGELKQSAVRTPLSSIRAKEKNSYSWLSDLKGRLDSSLQRANTAEEFHDLCRFAGVNVRFRGKGVSYSFQDKNGKQRIIRGRRLGENYTPQSFAFGVPEGLKYRTPEKAEAKRPGPSLPTPSTTGGAGIRRGRASGGGTGTGRALKTDKSWMDEVSRAQAEAREASQEQAIAEQNEANRITAQEVNNKPKPGGNR